MVHGQGKNDSRSSCILTGTNNCGIYCAQDMTETRISGQQLFQRLGSPVRVLAPMVDQSELAWRILSRKHGAQLAYTPMFHAKLFATSEKYRRDMWCKLDGDPAIDRPLIVQFCGNDPKYLVQAAKFVQDKCDAVDLNLGCPQGIARKGHYGAFLMDEWDLIKDLLEAMNSELDVPVTAKIRVFPEREKTLEYAKMILGTGVGLLGIHGRIREQKGQKTGLADWEIIKYLREQLPQDVAIFANGGILYPDDIARCMEEVGCDGVLSAEGNLYNPGIFEVDSIEDKEKVFPRVDKILREYFEIVKSCSSSNASKIAMKNHFFKILRPFLPFHTDIRAELAKMTLKNTFEEWEEKVVRPVEEVVEQIFQRKDIEKEDQILSGEKQPWGGCYRKIPYWRCQPYFRPVNGVTGDVRASEYLKAKSGTGELYDSTEDVKKRKPSVDLERDKEKTLKMPATEKKS